MNKETISKPKNVTLNKRERRIVENVQDRFGFGPRGFSAAMRFIVNRFDELQGEEFSRDPSKDQADPPDCP